MKRLGPDWREIAGGALALLLFGISFIAYASERFALKADIESRLSRIENKIDCLLNVNMCH